MKIRISGISDFFISPSFQFNRKLGKYTDYGITLSLNHSNSILLNSIASQLKKDTVKISLFLNDENTSLANDLELTNCEFIENPYEPRLNLKCVTNKVKDYQPGAFKLRNRVLKAQNLKELFKNYFCFIVELDNTIKVAFERIKFPDKEKTNLIQYKQTDYEMVVKLVAWYNTIVQPKESVIISGSAENDRIQIKWLQENKCADLNYNTSRRLDDKITSELNPAIRIGLGEMKAPKLFRQNTFSQNIVYIVNQGNFDNGNWEKWKKVELPAYYKENFVYQIQDNFSDANDEHLSWQSQIATLPNPGILDFPASNSTPWSGLGKVINRTSNDYWLEVELDDFEKNFNTADVRISTLYSGHKGNAGLHLVPEKNTEVQVIKGSNWLSPIVFLSNVRSEETIGEAPFWQLEDATQWNFQSTNIKVKDITTTAEDTVVVKTKGVNTKMDQSKMVIS